MKVIIYILCTVSTVLMVLLVFIALILIELNEKGVYKKELLIGDFKYALLIVFPLVVIQFVILQFIRRKDYMKIRMIQEKVE
ncbi:hypothetical protein AB4865_03900 [Capnocytophaga sp. ARDL2]|uniref:hypothetical protein n=1 Tax=Capnocytophaga sp. ARDL2 TaxID=3238809 RepID=UPI003555D056